MTEVDPEPLPPKIRTATRNTNIGPGVIAQLFGDVDPKTPNRWIRESLDPNRKRKTFPPDSIVRLPSGHRRVKLWGVVAAHNELAFDPICGKVVRIPSPYRIPRPDHPKGGEHFCSARCRERWQTQNDR